MRKWGWGLWLPPRIGTTVGVGELVDLSTDAPKIKNAMFPEETYLTRSCGRLCAGRAQLPVVAEEGGSLSDKMCMWEKLRAQNGHT